jgi:type II secretory pathway component GspD/PulD (secretin)
MKILIKIILIITLLTAQGAFIGAQTIGVDVSSRQMQTADTASPSMRYEEIDVKDKNGLETKISLDLRAMDVVDTIRFLAKQADVNIVTTRNVAGRITLFLKDVTVADALDIIIITNNLARKQQGGIITIMTEDEHNQLYGEKYISMVKSKTVILNYVDGQRASSMLENIKSSIGKIVVDELTGTIILIDTPKKIKDMEDLISKIDIPTIERIIPTVTEEFELSYAKAGEIQAEITAALTEQAGKIRIDERTNKLMVTDLAHNMEKIRQLVNAFDAKTREVFVEAKIIEVTLGDEYAFGVEWKKIFSKLANLKNITLTGTFPFTPIGASAMAVDIGTLAVDNYQIALKLIEDVGKTRILSSPHITVLNNEEAKFMVGTREAYVTQTISQGDVTTTVAENVEFIDVGVTLYVTPTINKEGFVQMNIRPEVSSIRDWLETTEGNKIPIVETSNMDTSVLVKDGHTVILAGFIKESDTKTVSKVPFLGNIPILGNAFKTISNANEKKELVIFLTPHITSDSQDNAYLVRDTRKQRKPAKQ